MIPEMVLLLVTTTVVAPVVEELRALLRQRDDQIITLLLGLLSQTVTPTTNFRLERDLDTVTRETNRKLLESVFNHLEPELPAENPPRIEWDGAEYRRN